MRRRRGNKRVTTVEEIWYKCKLLNGRLIHQRKCHELYDAEKCPSSCEKVYRKVKRSNEISI